MSALTQSRRSETSSLSLLAGWLAALAARYARALSRRQAMHELTRLDDRMLKDIGLFRTDIDAAASLPAGRDPIALLVSRRAGRRSNRFPGGFA